MPLLHFVLLQTSGVESWGDAVRGAFADAMGMLFGAVPKVLGFLIILIIGWIIAGIIARIVQTILEKANFNELGERSGFNDFSTKAGIDGGATEVVTLAVKWFIRLIVLVAAFDALGVSAISELLHDFLLWFPNLIVALVILVLAGLIANLVSGLVRGVAGSAGLGDPDLLAAVARIAIWAFAIVIIANQINLAEDVVNILFTAIVGALALALGLSFGLGGRDVAGQIVRNWYSRYQQLAAPGDRATGSNPQQMEDD